MLANGPKSFKDGFWEVDYQSTRGVETLFTYIKDGEKSVRWMETYVKARYEAEERYAQQLSKINK